MKIQTTRFGEVEVSDNSVFTFVSPILGYEEEKQFVLIEHKEGSKFNWFQSTTTPELAFVVTTAGLFDIEYIFEISDSAQDELEIEKAEDVIALNLVVIPHENPRHSTINLLAPIIVNVKNQKASQIILTGTNFTVDYPLFKDEKIC